MRQSVAKRKKRIKSGILRKAKKSKFCRNKRGIGPIGAIMLFIVFVVMWFMWLGGWVAQVGATAVAENGLTGIEAFAFENLNLCIMIFMILGMMGWMYFGGGA